MDYGVTFAGQADRDLEEIVRFLTQKNAAAAERLGYALVDDALSLTSMPCRGLAVQKRSEYRRIYTGLGFSFSTESTKPGS